jgi:hypothetical protein
MIAVVIVAGLFTLRGEYALIVLACSLMCVGVIGAQWLVYRGHRRVAAFAFWSFATLTNVVYAAMCVAPDIWLLIPLFRGWLFVIVPTVGSLGAAWVRLATRQVDAPRRSVPAMWASVIAACLLPLVTLWTLWPLHLAFITAKPALERLADQVAAGQTAGFPRWVGAFRVARAAVDPVSGNVGLMLDPKPNGQTGLVRVRAVIPANRNGPIRWDDLLVNLGSGWEYREED